MSIEIKVINTNFKKNSLIKYEIMEVMFYFSNFKSIRFKKFTSPKNLFYYLIIASVNIFNFYEQFFRAF